MAIGYDLSLVLEVSQKDEIIGFHWVNYRGSGDGGGQVEGGVGWSLSRIHIWIPNIMNSDKAYVYPGTSMITS